MLIYLQFFFVLFKSPKDLGGRCEGWGVNEEGENIKLGWHLSKSS